MLHDLSKSIKQLLAYEITSEEAGKLHADNIYFDAPGDLSPSTKLAVNLFLYDVRENRNLRSNEWQMERRNGMVTKQPPPVRIDCSYLITATAGDIGSELELLGQVMQTLLRYPTLPAQVLQGDELTNQSLPLPTSSLQPGKLQSMGEYWQALGGKPKAALHYTVTICVQPHEPIEAGPPVTDKQIPGERPKEN